ACENIQPGSDWMEEVEKALRETDMMVGIASTNSIKSKMVLREWWDAQESKKPLIPVLIEPCKAPYPFNSLQYIDFSTDESHGFVQLETALKFPKAEDFERFIAARPSPNKPTASAKVQTTNRTTMLQKVYDYWITGVLEPAKLGDVWLDLPAERRPNAV